MLDCEHAHIALNPGCAEAIQAVAGLGGDAPSVLVRVPAVGGDSSGGWQIKYALDAGARGVLVPMVSNAAIMTLIRRVSNTEESMELFIHHILMYTDTFV